MAFLDFLFGKKGKTEKFSPYTPQQQQYFQGALSSARQLRPQANQFIEALLGAGVGGGPDVSGAAMQRFEQDILPSLAERFTSQFGEGAGASSAFAQTLGGAGADLATQLAQQDFENMLQRQQLGLGGLGYLTGQQNIGLTPQFQERYIPGRQGLLGGLAQPVGKALGSGLTGGISSLLGRLL